MCSSDLATVWFSRYAGQVRVFGALEVIYSSICKLSRFLFIESLCVQSMIKLHQLPCKYSGFSTLLPSCELLLKHVSYYQNLQHIKILEAFPHCFLKLKIHTNKKKNADCKHKDIPYKNIVKTCVNRAYIRSIVNGTLYYTCIIKLVLSSVYA